MFRPVSGKSEIERLSRAVEFIPHRLAGFLPALGDGVTDEDEIVASLAGEFDGVLVAFLPPGFLELVHRDGRVADVIFGFQFLIALLESFKNGGVSGVGVHGL